MTEKECVLCAGSLDDAGISPMEGMPRKKPSGNRTLQMRNGVLKKAITEETSVLNITYESPTVSKQENSEMKEIDNKDLKTKTQETEGEAIPIIEGTVVITKIKGTTMENPSDIPSMLKEGRNGIRSSADVSNGDSKRSENDTMSKAPGNSVPENVGEKSDRENSKHLLNSTAGMASISEINPTEENMHMKTQMDAKAPTDSEKDTKYSQENNEGDSIRSKTHPPYISNKKQSAQNYDTFNLEEETITKFSTIDVIRKDFTGTKQNDHGQNIERPSGSVNGSNGQISYNANSTLMKKTGEIDVLLMGSPEDFTANPLNVKTNTYNDRYHTQATPAINSNFWSIGSRSTPVPNTKPTNLHDLGAMHNYTDTEITNQRFQETFLRTIDPPQIQSDEPWRPILPYYTKHSPKPEDDDIGTGVAEVVVIPPTAIENPKTSENQHHDNTYSSRLGKPATTHKLQDGSLGM